MTEKWLVIDAHLHYLPEEAATRTGRGGVYSSTLLRGGLDLAYQRLQDIEGIVGIMEDAGVDMVVLNQSAWSPHGLEVCRALNDGYARIARDYPGKFILCGHVPLQPGQEVLDEIERGINELGFKGMSLISSLPEVTLDSPELWPIYEKIGQLDVPIVVHPTLRSPLWGGDKKYEMFKTVSREYDIAKGVVEVIYSVLRDFPYLRFLMPHYGGGMVALKARVRANFEPDGWNIPAELQHCPKTPRELDELGIFQAFDELFDKLYFDMAGFGAGWVPMIKAALLTLRADRICFGTDYPYDVHNAEDIRSFINNIRELDIPENDKRLILGGNIASLFRI